MASTEPQNSVNPEAQAKADKAYAKAMRPWYKKKRFLFPLVLIVLIVITPDQGKKSGHGGEPTISAKPSITSKPAKPIVVSVEKMLTELDDNALAAAKKYDRKRVTVTGKLDSIDAAGNWFELVPSNSDFSLENIRIEITENQRDSLSAMKTGQLVTATGAVTRVDQTFGYTIYAESFSN